MTSKFSLKLWFKSKTSFPMKSSFFYQPQGWGPWNFNTRFFVHCSANFDMMDTERILFPDSEISRFTFRKLLREHQGTLVVRSKDNKRFSADHSELLQHPAAWRQVVEWETSNCWKLELREVLNSARFLQGTDLIAHCDKRAILQEIKCHRHRLLVCVVNNIFNCTV